MSGKKNELSEEGYANGLLARHPAYSQASVGPFTRGSWMKTHLCFNHTDNNIKCLYPLSDRRLNGDVVIS